MPFRLQVTRQIDQLPRSVAIGMGLLVGSGIGLLVAQASLWLGAGVVILTVGVVSWTVFYGGAGAVPVKADEAESTEMALDSALWAEISGGTFWRGSPREEEGRDDDEGPRHRVTISSLQCMRAPVTRKLYREVWEAAGDHETALKAEGEDDHPMTNVSWFDAVKFCNQWSIRDQLQPCYQLVGDEGEGDEPAVIWHLGRNGYRLATEAEWEYLVRAGTKSRYFFGDDVEPLGEFAWYMENSEEHLQPVAQKAANAWGLYDMHGNVWEWCWDWYATKYPWYVKYLNYLWIGVKDPVGPKKGIGRVLRGGACVISARDLRAAFRGWNWPENSDRETGFRCVRGPLRQS